MNSTSRLTKWFAATSFALFVLLTGTVDAQSVCPYSNGPSPTPDSAPSPPDSPSPAGCLILTSTDDTWVEVENSCDLVGLKSAPSGTPRTIVLRRGDAEIAIDSLHVLMVHAVYYADTQTTLVCAQKMSDSCNGVASVVCWPIQDGSSAPGPAYEPVASDGNQYWLNQVTDHGALIRQGVGLFEGPAYQPDTAPGAPLAPQCDFLSWDAQNQAWSLIPSQGCDPTTMDGKPCSDPCYVGTGSWKNGGCDVSGLSDFCPSDQVCNGNQDPSIRCGLCGNGTCDAQEDSSSCPADCAQQ